MSSVIDNDFHPVDQGLSATEDHWGTEKPIESAKLINMVDRGRSRKSNVGYSETMVNKPEMRN